MFASQDKEYDNLDDDGTDPNNGQNLNDGGKNDDIGSDVTPMADNFDPSHPLYRTIAAWRGCARPTRRWPTAPSRRASPSPAAGVFAFSRTDAGEQVEYLVALNNSTTAKTAHVADVLGRGCRSSGSGATARARLKTAGERVGRRHRPGALGGRLPRGAPHDALQGRAVGDARPRPRRSSGRPEIARHASTAPRSTRSPSTRTGTAAWAPTTTRPTACSPTSRATRAGTRLALTAVVKDNAGHTSVARGATTVVAPPDGQRRARPRSTTTARPATTPAGACTCSATRSPTASAPRGTARGRRRASTTSAPCSRSRSRTRRPR